MPLISIILVTALLIFANSFFVATEFSVVSSRKTRINQMAESGNWRAKIALSFIEDSRMIDVLLAATQVGITVSSLALGAYGQRTIATALAPILTRFGGWSDTVAFSISATTVLLMLTAMQMLIGETMPKSVAIRYPESTVLIVAPVMSYMLVILKPLVWIFKGSSNYLLRLLKIDYEKSSIHIHSPSEIEILVMDSYAGGLIDDRDRQLLRNVFRLRELTARQVMIPRTRLVTTSSNNKLQEVIQLCLQSGYTRIPVYNESIDDITGFVHFKDLFKLFRNKGSDIESILREVIYIPETMPIIDVWEKLKKHRQYMVIVFDEYGGTAGMITFEDLIEEIFGELQDEFDEELALIYSDSQGRTHLRGDLLISDINEYLDLELPDDDIDTIGGLVFNELGHLPNKGEEIVINNTIIRVEVIEDSHISEVSIELPEGAELYIREWEFTGHD
ncbi:MAG: hypothetical protein B6242_10780 [Anaerolineaceae bacterium 4572_78]|nr:MAG: hypothetical protein B6242_10780 [Anaerolineaceae bacterium 4572_78]